MGLPSFGAGMSSSMGLPSFGAGMGGPPPNWHKTHKHEISRALSEWRSAGEPPVHIMDSPQLGGRLEVRVAGPHPGGGFGSMLAGAGRALVRWLAPLAKSAAPALQDAAKSAATDAAKAALTGEGSLADRLRAASSAGAESAKASAMQIGKDIAGQAAASL